jgi:hypothetical protein
MNMVEMFLKSPDVYQLITNSIGPKKVAQDANPQMIIENISACKIRTIFLQPNDIQSST